MPYIDAVIFTKWIEVDEEGETAYTPNAISDIYAWAIAHGEQLPDGTYGRYEDLTGQAGGSIGQRILDNLGVFVAKLEITVATAQQFANDPRIWTLGYWRRDDDGEVIDHNWDTTLTVAERQRAVQYITGNSNITAQQLAAVFDATDTRREIAEKLRTFFRE